MVVDSSRRVLGRLRCLNDCAKALLECRPLPECVCYVPGEVEYKPKRSVSLTIYTKPSKTGGQKTQLLCTSKHRIFLAITGPERNEEGRLVKIKKIFESDTQIQLQPADQWIVFSSNELVPVKANSENITCWEDVVDHKYMVNINDKKGVMPPDDHAVAKMLGIPSGWTVGHDQALVQLMSAELRQWFARDFVDSVEASENQERAVCILNEDSNGSWTSYDSVSHVILNMKKNTMISSLVLCFSDESEQMGCPHVPQEIAVYGGEKDSLVLLYTSKLEYSSLSDGSFTVRLGQSQHFPSLKLVFTDSGNGSGIQVKSLTFQGSLIGVEKSDVERGILTKRAIDSQPLLASYEPDVISHRSLLLQRIVQLFDSVLMYMMPVWEYSAGSFDSLQVLQGLLPLSKKRKKLINTLLKQTEDSAFDIPTLYIRRNILNFVDKLDAEETVFSQIYNGLMKGVKDDESKVLTYRVSAEMQQWWRCVFSGEGIIDQGGGFRDTLSDIAEELCPCAADSPLLLPFFIPCPNQQSGVASSYRDAYIPNPSCKEFHRYEWIGKLMGACLRSEENLAITLSAFFWKLLAEHRVSWLDFVSVDEAQVLTVNEMEKMDKDSFEAYFGGMRTWTVVLSDGTSVPLKPNGDQLIASYEERLEYVQLVREARMNETKQQVDAIRKGLLQVVPKAILKLLTSDELEMKICGYSEISFENMKKHVILNNPSKTDLESVKHLWTVLENFTSNDRSQFLRFATGRRRLPANVYVDIDSGIDVLPSASTCGHHFSMPTYSSAQKAEEMIRLAIYGCKFIDTDTAIVV